MCLRAPPSRVRPLLSFLRRHQHLQGPEGRTSSGSVPPRPRTGLPCLPFPPPVPITSSVTSAALWPILSASCPFGNCAVPAQHGVTTSVPVVTPAAPNPGCRTLLWGKTPLLEPGATANSWSPKSAGSPALPAVTCLCRPGPGVGSVHAPSTSPRWMPRACFPSLPLLHVNRDGGQRGALTRTLSRLRKRPRKFGIVSTPPAPRPARAEAGASERARRLSGAKSLLSRVPRRG